MHRGSQGEPATITVGVDISTRSSFSIGNDYLFEVDDRLPELILCPMEISHADFAKVTGMIFVDIRSMMMLTTSHTTTTWMLPVLSYSTMTR